MKNTLAELMQARIEELGWQHPAICLAEAALMYRSTEACNGRAMMLAFKVLSDATR